MEEINKEKTKRKKVNKYRIFYIILFFLSVISLIISNIFKRTTIATISIIVIIICLIKVSLIPFNIKEESKCIICKEELVGECKCLENASNIKTTNNIHQTKPSADGRVVSACNSLSSDENIKPKLEGEE